jgi:hypothetical protein
MIDVARYLVEQNRNQAVSDIRKFEKNVLFNRESVYF